MFGRHPIRDAAEKGARDEVRKVMERLFQPVVEKAMANGVEVNMKGPGGIVLLSICLRIPDVAGGISERDAGTIQELLQLMNECGPLNGEQSAAIGKIFEVLERKDVR